MSKDIREILKCNECRVTACPICELHGIISNMHRIGDKFVCNTCNSEIWLGEE